MTNPIKRAVAIENNLDLSEEDIKVLEEIIKEEEINDDRIISRDFLIVGAIMSIPVLFINHFVSIKTILLLMIVAVIFYLIVKRENNKSNKLYDDEVVDDDREQ